MKIWIFLSFLLSLQAFAFPEMVRHHYVNCTACHFSPSGGGLTTDYGRQMSQAVLSTWGSEKEAGLFHGAIDPDVIPKWLHMGGNIRAIQIHQENSQFKMGKFIRMQTGVELAATLGNWTAVSFIGRQEEDNKVRDVSPRYYVMNQLTEEVTLRAGRFIPNFGLNIPQHTWPTKRNLGFDEGTERDQIELMWSGEKWNWSLTSSESVVPSKLAEKERALSGQLNYTLQDSYRFGISYWNGQLETKKRDIWGVHAILGFSEALYYLSEFDLQRNIQAETTQGLFHFSKLGYELHKGFHVWLYEDYGKANLDDSQTLTNAYGIGSNFYPRPHFEFEALWTKKRIVAMSEEYGDSAYLMMHYYF